MEKRGRGRDKAENSLVAQHQQMKSDYYRMLPQSVKTV